MCTLSAAASDPGPHAPGTRTLAATPGSAAAHAEPGNRRVVLIADPDRDVAQALITQLAEHGIDATVCTDGAQALFQAGALDPDVVLVSASLPLVSGATFVTVLRASRDTPVLVAVDASDPAEGMRALEAGATACISKPYRPSDVLTLLRSIRPGLLGPDADEPTVLRRGGLILDADSHRVLHRGVPVILPRKEFELLRFLMVHSERMVSREQIRDAVWGPGYGGETNTVTVHVRRLRGRLGDDVDQPRLIQTVRGLGYRFVPDQ